MPIFPMITSLAMTAIGVFLGLYFTVFVLFPATAITAIGILAVVLGDGSNIWSTAFTTLFMITGLQVGYIVGTVIRFGVGRAATANAGQTSSVAPER